MFFVLLAAFCLYLYFTGAAGRLKHFSLFGTAFAGFIGIIFLKNGIKK